MGQIVHLQAEHFSKPAMEPGTQGPHAPNLVKIANHLLRAREIMQACLPRSAIRDSAWAVLLQVFVSEAENQAVCVTEVMRASGETSTTAARLIDRLDEAHLIERVRDRDDARRVNIRLSEQGRGVLAAILSELAVSPLVSRTPTAVERRSAH